MYRVSSILFHPYWEAARPVYRPQIHACSNQYRVLDAAYSLCACRSGIVRVAIRNLHFLPNRFIERLSISVTIKSEICRELGCPKCELVGCVNCNVSSKLIVNNSSKCRALHFYFSFVGDGTIFVPGSHRYFGNYLNENYKSQRFKKIHEKLCSRKILLHWYNNWNVGENTTLIFFN